MAFAVGLLCREPVSAQCPSIDYALRSTFAPYVAQGWDTVAGCSGQGLWLQASTVVTSASFNGTYRVDSIPFDPPHPFNTGTQIFLNEDDKFANAISLPFGFCFFGQTYNTACVGANGVISLGSSMARQTCVYDYSRYSPIPNTRFPIKNAIYGIYEDIDPRVNTNVANRGIYQAVVGQYPCRQLCVSWNGISQYGRGVGFFHMVSQYYSTYQIVLHEGTNIIDVYVQTRRCCSTTNEGLGTIGIQNAAGTSAFTAPGRNGWTGDVSTPEAWRFVPQGPLNYNVSWYLGTDTSAATGILLAAHGDSLFVTPDTTTTYTARLTYMACNGLSYDLTTQITVGIDTCRAAIAASASQICPSQPDTLSVVPRQCANVEHVLWNTGDTSRSIVVRPTATAHYTALVTYHNGCTDTLGYSVIVSDTMIAYRYDTIVENQLPWSHRGHSFTAPAARTAFVYTDTTGCPVRENYSLHVWMNVRHTADSSVCENNLPLVWNGHTFASAGTYVTTFAAGASHGEDSTLTMRVAVRRNTYSTLYDTAVQNSLPLTVCGTAVTTMAADTSLTITAANQAGCDSVVSYHLHVWCNVSARADSAVCRLSLPLTWNGHTFADSGAWVANMLTTHGADSTLTMHVSVNENPTVWVGDTIVERQLPWRYRGLSYNAAARDTFVVANASRCDSIINYSLHVWYNTSGRADTAVCYNHLPLRWHGWLFDTTAAMPTAMSRVDTLRGMGMHGVDSILTITLHVSPVYSLAIYDTVCTGGRFFCGRQCDSMGQYRCTLTTSQGCDSVVTLHLTVNSETHSYEYDTVCQRDLPFARYNLHISGIAAPHGVVHYDTSTTYTIHNTSECDSVIHYHLHINLNSYDTVDTACCANQLPLTWRGRRYTRGGMANDTLPSHNGADSVVSFRLTVRDTSQTTMHVEACDSYLWIDGRRYTYSTSAPQVTLRNSLGCDSVVRLELIVDHVLHTVCEVTACDSFTWIDGNTYSSPTTTASVTFESDEGCDSVVTLHLTLHHSQHTYLFDTFCRSEQYRFGAGRVLTDPGTYHDTLRTRRGCDSIVTLRLAVRQQPPLEIVSTYSCRTACYTLTAQSNVDYYSWSASPDDPVLSPFVHNKVIYVSPQQPTVYTVCADYYDHTTCPSFRSISLEPLLPVKAEIEVSPTFLTYGNNRLTAIDRSHGHDGRNWYLFGEYYGSNAYIYYTNIEGDSVPLMLEVYNSSCRDTAYRLVQVRKYALWVPSAFTPDAADGTNRIFAAVGEGIAQFEMHVYSRNGVIVFHSDNIHEGWDGTYRGTRCPQGAYTYVIRYLHIGTNEAYEVTTGTVLLIR